MEPPFPPGRDHAAAGRDLGSRKSEAAAAGLAFWCSDLSTRAPRFYYPVSCERPRVLLGVCKVPRTECPHNDALRPLRSSDNSHNRPCQGCTNGRFVWRPGIWPRRRRLMSAGRAGDKRLPKAEPTAAPAGPVSATPGHRRSGSVASRLSDQDRRPAPDARGARPKQGQGLGGMTVCVRAPALLARTPPLAPCPLGAPEGA